MYKTREAFYEDVELIYKNSCAYNGKESQFTLTAERFMEVCIQALSEVGVTGCSLIYCLSIPVSVWFSFAAFLSSA